MITSGNYEEGTGSKPALMLGAVVLVCAPMVLSLLLLLAVMWPRMDRVTQHMPKAVRSMVASGILEVHDEAATPLQLQRAGHLDAEAAARYRPPVLGFRPPSAPPKMQELYRQQREAKQAAAALVQKAKTEQAGRPGVCGAASLCGGSHQGRKFRGLPIRGGCWAGRTGLRRPPRGADRT